ncbi:MAG: arginine--tRNA ligase [Candidatus Dependentiae bacterium]|nr:arginine--tRNA ligase [Candidatus Dependentiae bacterium]
MNIIEQIQQHFIEHIVNVLSLDKETASTARLTLNSDPAKQEFGDLNSNIALILSKQLKRKPHEIAQQIISTYTHECIEKIEIAGPGFLNLHFSPHAITLLSQQLRTQGENFFKPTNLQKQSISVEFVSANPTGPLHFGHGRGGIIGDVLGTILTFMGHHVTKEFYINDAGNQIVKLGESFKIRCQQLAGMDIEIPEDGYQGEYLVELAQNFMVQEGKQRLDQPDEFFQSYAKTILLEKIKETLNLYGIHFDVWFSEKTLHDSGAIEKALEFLAQQGTLYEKEGALWFASTNFGDDKDRVVRKASGELTYVAADIAYMINKVGRGCDQMIMTLGHDHHGYVERLQGIRKALHLTPPLHVILYQLVKIKEDGQQVRLSKRAGRIISLDDVIKTVGKDVARFFYLNRKADAQLEFDLDLALKKSEENPVYYVQYAFVRTGSIVQKAQAIAAFSNITTDDARFISKEETFLLKKIVLLKELLESISSTHQTHQLAYYTHELAQIFSSYYAKHKVIDPQDINRSRGRLFMTLLIRNTLQTCFNLLGISQPERM